MKIQDIKKLVSGFSYFKIDTLFDPIQTHAIYGISKCDIEPIKNKLKPIANRFRKVKANNDSYILCFKIK